MAEAEMNLKEYVEGRFNRLSVSLEERRKAQQCEFLAIIEANDLRYQQRFEAQGKALDAAFGAAKEAVNAALAGADKASVKTEQTADKRFADLGDLIREQFKGLTDKLEAAIRRIEVIEGRINLTSGESEGKTAMWTYVAAAIGILFGLSGVALTIIHLMRP